MQEHKNLVEKSAYKLDQLGEKYLLLPSFLPKKLKGDALAFFVAPLVFLILVFVTAVLILAAGQFTPIWQQTAQQFNLNATYSNIPINILNNYYSFDSYLPFIFYMVMIAIIFSAVLLDSNPISWLVGIIEMPIIYYVNVYISNAAHGILGQPILATGVSHLPTSLVILATLPTITFLFGLMYLIVLAVRINYFKPNEVRARA